MPLQVINQNPAVTMMEVDLTKIDPARQSSEVDALLETARHRIADCEQKALFHVALITLSRERHVLQMTLPALCADTVGLDRLVRSIAQAYTAFMNKEEPSEEPVQYADLSEWQNELLEAEDTRTGRAFWRRQDYAALHDLELPTEKEPAPVGATHLGATTIAYGPNDLQIVTGETIEDTARVLANFLDVLVIRTNQSLAEMRALANQDKMSIVNAMSDNEHPTQAIADLVTLQRGVWAPRWCAGNAVSDETPLTLQLSETGVSTWGVRM